MNRVILKKAPFQGFVLNGFNIMVVNGKKRLETFGATSSHRHTFTPRMMIAQISSSTELHFPRHQYNPSFPTPQNCHMAGPSWHIPACHAALCRSQLVTPPPTNGIALPVLDIGDRVPERTAGIIQSKSGVGSELARVSGDQSIYPAMCPTATSCTSGSKMTSGATTGRQNTLWV